MSDLSIILQDNEFCWILNSDSGIIELCEGPARLTFLPNQTMYKSKMSKIVLKNNEFVVVKNPYDASIGECVMGRREIRKGPMVFSLYPFEEIDGGIRSAYILAKNEALVMTALENFDGHKAGEQYLIRGPVKYLPGKNERVERTVSAINVGQNQAIYVRSKTTSELKMVVGPVSYLLEVDEELYEKKLSTLENRALGIPDKVSYFAPVIQVQKNEVLCVVNFQKNNEKYIDGPAVHILDPHEGVKVVSLSGGVPKQENQVVAARVPLGPDFIVDQFQIRTKDNALLRVTVHYKWRFMVDKERLDKLFAADYVGYSCQSMRSRVREAAARTDFEAFHNSSAEILRANLFKEYKIDKTTTRGRWFPEFSFLIFELDVTEVVPVDAEIAELLNESIKSNMQILCRKLEASAQFNSQKEQIESQVEIARLRQSLIRIENANYTKSTIERARIEGEALLEKAKAEKDAEEILSRASMEGDISRMKEMIGLLGTPNGKLYLELVRAQSFSKVKSATILPADTKTLFLPPTAAATL